MVRVPGLPRSTYRALRGLFSGSVLDVLWKVSISIGFLAVIYVLIVGANVYGALLAGAIFSSLLSDDVRKLVSDVWHRRWASVSIPYT